MRWTVLVTALLMAGLRVSMAVGDEVPGTPQLLVNGGFEEGTGEAAAAWGLWPPAGTEAGVGSLRDGGEKHSGSFSGRLRIERGDFAGVCTWHHGAVPVQPGQELVLQLWIRAQDVTDRCGCDVQLRRGADIVGSAGMEMMKGSFGWKQLTHRFTVPAGVDRVCVVPLLYGKGTVWLDDLALYSTPSAQPGRASEPPKVDGDLGDACWRQAAALGGFTLASGSGAPERATTVLAAYDPAHLYFAFRCEKKPGDKLRKAISRRDGPVWEDDDIEVFLNPAADRGQYYQFVVNPRGTQYDSCGQNPSWNGRWQAASKETPAEWIVELSIPLSDLPLDLTTGQSWCANFGRADKVGGEASSWSCVFGGFHSPGRFGTLENMALDLVPYYLKDAQARVGTVRQAYDRALAGLDPGTAPAAIAAPVVERQGRIRAGLTALEALVRSPQTATAEDWRRLRPQAAALATDIADLQAASMRLRAYTLWREGAGTPRFGLAVAPAMSKLRRDGNDFPGEVTRTMRLSAARNEYEAAQVVVVPLGEGDLHDCRAQVSTLTGPGGATIPAGNLKLSLVGYVKTSKPTYQTAYVGDWPDPLLPLTDFGVKAGEVQPLWLRVYVPAQAKPGDYRGTLTVTSGQEKHALDLALHVYNFSLPRRQHLATPFGCAPATLSKWYTGDSDYLTRMPPEVWTRWNSFLLDYRITPTHVGTAYVKESRDAQGRRVYDYSTTDRCVAAVADRLPPQGVAMAGIGNLGWASANGARLKPVAQTPHGGTRCGQVSWPKTDSWASLDRSMPGQTLAARGCRAFRFWVKAPSAGLEDEQITAFVNDFPRRWVTTFPLGGAEWHEVRIPIEQYHYNGETSEPLTPAGLKNCGDFQFVIAKKARPLEYLIDDITAECADGSVVIDDFEPETQAAAIHEEMGARLKHWQQKGWFNLGHVYAKDEIRPEEYEQVIPWYREALRVAPQAPLMQTYYVNRTPRELVGVTKIWCAITSIYDDEFLAPRRRAGEPTWLYVCCGPSPPYANFFIDQPGIDHRMLFWQTWQRNCTGLLYWETNYWHGMMPEKAEEPHWPQVPWDQEKVATYREFKVNGDGFLVYPGPDWTPLPSVRMENIRDGIEDYEYLWLLREKNPKSPLLQVGDDLSKDFTHFCKDPRVLEARRQQVAKAIEAASR